MDFALTEPLANVSYLTELVIWLLTLIVWVYTPGLIGVAVGAWRQGNPDSGAVYISRFVSYGLFRFLSYVLGSLSIALTVLRLSSREGLLLGSDYTSLVTQLVVLFLGVYLFLYFRSKAFKLWRYVLLDDLTGGLLAQDYFFQDWLRALLMALVSLLTFAPLPTLVLWWIAISTCPAPWYHPGRASHVARVRWRPLSFFVPLRPRSCTIPLPRRGWYISDEE